MAESTPGPPPSAAPPTAPPLATAASARETWVRWLSRGAKLAIVLLVLWGIRGTLGEALDALARQPRRLVPGWLLAAGVAYLLGCVPLAEFYHRVLLAAGQHPTRWASWRAFFVSELGKYVPGKAMVVVIRAGLVQGPRVDPAVAAVAVFYETFSMMAVGALLAAAIATVWLGDQAWLVGLAWGVAVVAWLPLVPALFRRAARLGRRASRDPAALERWHMPLAEVAPGWLGIAFGWILWGASLDWTLRALGAAPADWTAFLPRATAAGSLAVVLGFFSLVPGGAVVREGVMMELLRPAVGEGPALLAPIVLRLVWVVAEVVVSIILYGIPAAGAGQPGPPPGSRPGAPPPSPASSSSS